MSKRISLIVLVIMTLSMALGANGLAQETTVTFSAEVQSSEDQPHQYRVMVNAKIAPGWHLNASLPPGDPSQVVLPELTFPQGVHAIAGWEMPAANSKREDGTSIFKSKLTMWRSIQLDPKDWDGKPIKLEVAYQACDPTRCEPPAIYEVVLKLPQQNSVGLAAGQPVPFVNPYFEAPVRLRVSDQPLNVKAGQKYPSPAWYDVDHDGQVELIVGDIFGTLNVYENVREATERKDTNSDPVWGEPTALKSVDGEKIKVSNW